MTGLFMYGLALLPRMKVYPTKYFITLVVFGVPPISQIRITSAI